MTQERGKSVFNSMGVPLLFLEQNSLLFITIILAVIIGLIVMMVVYLKTEAMYKK